MRLYCFPYAGGGWQVFRDWPDMLPGVELWMVQLPGRGMRFKEEALSSMPPLVQNLADHLPQNGGDEKAYAFYGHSMGARLAFELTRSLRRRQMPLPDHLLVSGCQAPQLPFDQRPIHNLPREAFLHELERRNGTPPEVMAHEELLDLLLPMLRADFAVFETAVYQSEAPLLLPISAFGGLDDPIVSPEALQAWSEQTMGSFSASFLPGDHFFLRTAEEALLNQIGRILT